MNVVVTGASRGIGKTVAEYFAAEGANLFLCSRNMEKTTVWQQELMKKHNIQITSFSADLGVAEQAKHFAEQVLKAADAIDILINNIGIYEQGVHITNKRANLNTCYRSTSMLHITLPAH
jgi:short-subunit dehydrogenase